MPMSRKRTRNCVFCPLCNAQGSPQPVLSPMSPLFVEGGKSATVQPYLYPHFVYKCPRCSFSEIHETILDE